MPHPKSKGNVTGKQIKRFRKIAGMTQTQLSAALSVDHGVELATDLISRIESGERSLRDQELLAIAVVLEVTPNDLFGIAEE